MMAERSLSPSKTEQWCAILLLAGLSLLLLLSLTGMIASLTTNIFYAPVNSFIVIMLELGSLIFIMYLLRTKQTELRRPLPLAMLAGSILGIYLGSIFNQPNYIGLRLIFGIFGPFMAMTSPGPGNYIDHHMGLDVTLSTLAVVLSLVLYGLVAFFVTRQTGNSRLGLWGAFLTSFITTVIATITFVIIVIIQFKFYALSTFISYQYLPLSTSLLFLAQVIHALVGGLIGGAFGSRRHRGVNMRQA